MLDFLLAPFRFIWEMFPPIIAIPIILGQLVFFAMWMVKYTEMLEETVDQEQVHAGGYHPERGYKFDVEDFE